MRTKRKRGRPRVHIPIQLVQGLWEDGLSLRRIAIATGFGYGSVRRALHAHLNEGNSGRLARAGSVAV